MAKDTQSPRRREYVFAQNVTFLSTAGVKVASVLVLDSDMLACAKGSPTLKDAFTL